MRSAARTRGLAVVLCALAAACSRGPSPLTRTEAADIRRSEADWLREEPVSLLRDYVRIDTRPSKGEKEGAEFLRRFFECAGIEVEVVCPAPERCNVLARIPGRTREGALLLLNHIDVVDVYPAGWKEAEPFSGTIKHGFLYGRGSYDMKSLGLAQALAMRNLKRTGVVPARDILFLAEADEEIGQKWGARWLLEHRPDFFAGVGEVLNEGGTTEVIVRDVRFWGLETLQAGYAFAEFEAESAAPLEALGSRWPRLDTKPVSPHPHVVEGFEMLANHLSSPLTDPLRHLDRVVKDPKELAILPDRYASFLEARLVWSPAYPNPGHPERSRRLLVLSVPPGVDPRIYLQPIVDDAKRAGLTLTQISASEVSVASPYPTPFTELLRRVTEARFPGVPFGPVPTFGGYTTSILLRQHGIPAYGYTPIPTNITDAARRHGNDERIYLRDFLIGVALFSDVLEEFATVPPAAN
jgi:acetylornithine deacetylase/succinyl-diaminopimelate desuccinylase-like protein